MAWYQRWKLGWDSLRNLPSRPMHKYYAAMGIAASASGVYLSNAEAIPYSNRTRVLLMPRQFERAIEDQKLRRFLKRYEGKVLPATHPTSVRVRLVAKRCIEALHRDLVSQGYDSVEYLKHVNWQVVVVDDASDHGTTSFTPGAIVLFTGNLRRNLDSDAKIAAVVAPEVASVVARHNAELMVRLTRFSLFQAILNKCFGKTGVHQKIINLLAIFPLRRKLDLEAQRMGVLLMASAGYHPRVSLNLWQHSAAYSKDSGSYWDGLLTSYAPAKKRVQVISQAQDQAMSFYSKTLSV